MQSQDDLDLHFNWWKQIFSLHRSYYSLGNLLNEKRVVAIPLGHHKTFSLLFYQST